MAFRTIWLISPFGTEFAPLRTVAAVNKMHRLRSAQEVGAVNTVEAIVITAVCEIDTEHRLAV